MVDMEQDSQTAELRQSIVILLLAGSLILFAGSVYLTKNFAIEYGAGLGAVLQSIHTNSSIVQSLQPVVANLSLFRLAIDISYMISVLSLLLFGAAFLLFIRRKELGTGTIRTYGLLHSASMIFYTIVFALLLSYFYTYMNDYYLYIIYFGIAVCLAADIYIQYDLRMNIRPNRARSSIHMDPSRPFSNMVSLKEGIFSKMSGHLRIVDKHFNSSSMVNFHRLVSGYAQKFNRITVLTSEEMLDGAFPTSVTDMKNEFAASGTEFEVRILDKKDAADQHERIVLDDSIAYNIPPFNIINRKSEHVSRIKLSDANSRFHYLYGRASKIDNYLVRKGHEADK